MDILALIITCTISIYFFGTLAFLFFGKIKWPYITEDEGYSDIQVITAEDIPKAEVSLLQNPGDLILRLSILKAIFADGRSFHNPGIGLDHAKWIVTNNPEYIRSVLVQTPFLILKDKETISKEIITPVIEREKRSLAILRDAARFCTNLNYSFALECAEEAFQKENLNPDILSGMAQLKGFQVEDYENPQEWIPSWQVYKKLISWTWSEYDFLKLEFLKNKFGKLIWPYPLAYIFLYIKGRLSNGLIGYTGSAFDLAMAGNIAIFAHDFKGAQKIGTQSKIKLAEYEKVCHHPPLLFHSYSFHCRLALWEKDMQEVSFYLKKREQFPAESEFGLPDEVANALVKAGYIQMAVDHYKTLARDIPDNKSIKRYIKIIESGRLLDPSTYKEAHESNKEVK